MSCISITHKEPLYSTYQANNQYLSLLNITDYLFVNFNAVQVSVALEKKHIPNSKYFDLVTPINFPQSLGILFPNLLPTLIKALQQSNTCCLYFQTKDDFNFDGDSDINIQRYRTNYYFDLALSERELLANMKKDARQRLRKAIKNISFNFFENEVSSEFITNYQRIGLTNNFSLMYQFTEDQLLGFADVVGIKYIEIRNEGKFVAGGFFGVNDTEVDYLYGANNEYITDSIRLLIWTAIQYFQKQKAHKLFLGGGVSEHDSLATFKARNGTYEQKCRTIRAVINKDKAQCYANASFSKAWFLAYFPPYRKPAPLESNSVIQQRTS